MNVRILSIILAISCILGCNTQGTKGGTVIKEGSTVKINYTLTVAGEKVDSSEGRGPLTYVSGKGDIIPGLEKELVGLKTGDKKKVNVTPEDGYGKVIPEAIQELPKEAFDNVENIKVGGIVQGERDGRMFQAVVKTVADKSITLDFNHPLAGKTLEFDVEVVEVK